jgi:transposase-like protein
MPRRYPPKMRRQVIELARAGTRVKQLAVTFQISQATVYNWTKQDKIDRGELDGLRINHLAPELRRRTSHPHERKRPATRRVGPKHSSALRTNSTPTTSVVNPANGMPSPARTSNSNSNPCGESSALHRTVASNATRAGAMSPSACGPG